MIDSERHRFWWSKRERGRRIHLSGDSWGPPPTSNIFDPQPFPTHTHQKKGGRGQTWKSKVLSYNMSFDVCAREALGSAFSELVWVNFSDELFPAKLYIAEDCLCMLRSREHWTLCSISLQSVLREGAFRKTDFLPLFFFYNIGYLEMYIFSP